MLDIINDLSEKRLKIVLVGDLGTGKTSIALKFCNDEFTRLYRPTSGIDFFLKNVSLGCYKNVNLQLWDVSGLSLGSNMLDKYLYEANIILLVYDITNSSSFDALQYWVEKIREFCKNFHIMPITTVVGNKSDMEHERTIKREKSYLFAAENGFLYHDVSARTGESVSFCIVNLAAKSLGIQLTKSDQDFYKPILTAEIGDSINMPIVYNQKIIKRHPNKKHAITHHVQQKLSMPKSTACCLQ